MEKHNAITFLNKYFENRNGVIVTAWETARKELVEGQKTNHQQLKQAILLVLKTAAEIGLIEESYNHLNDILQSLAKRAGV